MKNILLAGVGGQGTVLASKLLAQAAMEKGQKAHTAETIGMAQRGGCVVSHVRIGNDVFAPLIPHKTADLILGFEPAEAVRCLPYLASDGVVVTAKKAIKPVTASLSGSDYNGEEMIEYLQKTVSRVVVVDGEQICVECGSPKVLNIGLLGAAIGAGALDFTLDEMIATMKSRLPTQYLKMNQSALLLGAQLADKQ